MKAPPREPVNREGAWFWDVEKTSEHRPDLEVLEEAASRHEKRIKEFMVEAAQLFIKNGWSKQGVRTLIRDIDNGVARDIIEEAGVGCDAVVVGRQGLSSLELKGHLIGSTTNRLAAHMGKLPLWVVGGAPDTKKILVAMDETLLSMKQAMHGQTLFGFPSLDGPRRSVQIGSDVLPGVQLLQRVRRRSRVGTLSPPAQHRRPQAFKARIS